MQKRHSNENLPVFPKRKSQNSYLNLKELEERREQLNSYIVFLTARFNDDQCLREFLKPEDKLPVYGNKSVFQKY
jgi:hypothetical protein